MKKNAFTLIELLVVISIISLLVSILLPSLSKAKELAKSAMCMSNQNGVAKTMYLYASDYDDNLPANYHPNTAPGVDWRVLLTPYLGGDDDGILAGEGVNYNPIFECPSKIYSDTSAWVNLFPPNGLRPGTGINIWLYPAYDRSVCISDIGKSLQDVFLTMDTADHLGFTTAPANWNFSPDIYVGFHHGGGKLPLRSSSYGDFRYDGDAMAAFADGHCESLSVDDCGDLWTDEFWATPL